MTLCSSNMTEKIVLENWGWTSNLKRELDLTKIASKLRTSF